MTKLNKTENAVLEALRAAVESEHSEGWGTVYLDNVVCAVSERQFSGYLSALEKKGFYIAEKNDPCFGRVATAIVATAAEPKAKKAPAKKAAAKKAPKAEKAPKAKKGAKKVAAIATYGHRSARTAALHTAFDTMSRKDALKYAIEELGYTASGASSWFADWRK